MLTFLDNSDQGAGNRRGPLARLSCAFFRGNVGMLLFSAGMLVRVEILLSTCRHFLARSQLVPLHGDFDGLNPGSK